MKVAFDGRYAENDLVGIGKYIASLVSEIARNNIECLIFYSQKPKYPIYGKNISFKILPSLNRYVFEQINLPSALKKGKVDLYHATGNLGIPLFCPVPAVLTVHDIIPILVKDYFNYSKYKYLAKSSYLFRLKTSLVKAKAIITVSQFTKQTLIENLHIPTDKIKVIYSGAPEINNKTSDLPTGLQPKQYILNQGGIDIRKNLDCLITAFAKVIKEFPKLKIVITGENKNMKQKLQQQAIDLGIRDAVVFPGYVSEELLWSLIRQARCICYPSLIEGFGWPVLEGFAAGVPVITSATSSLSEISEGVAYLINPLNEDNISSAMLKILQNSSLRNKLIDKGIKRLGHFSWKKTASETIHTYQEILG